MSQSAMMWWITILMLGIAFLLGLAISDLIPQAWDQLPPPATTVPDYGPGPAEIMWEAAKNRNPYPAP